MERPCLPQAFPHSSPLWNVPLLSCTLLLPRTWNSEAEREVGNWVGPGLEETWEHYLFKGKASPPHSCHYLNWFLLICSGSLWIVVDWLISRALGEDWEEPCIQ